jgi:hypothetical protein
MRHIIPILIILIVASCGHKKQTVAVVEELEYPAEGLFTTDYKYLFFGKIGFNDRTFQEDTLVYPPIDGLVHKSAFVMCPTDTCVAERAVLALRCPPVEPLLRWMADTVYAFVEQCPIGGGLLTYNEKSIDIPKKYFNSAEAICNYYIDQLQHSYDDWRCTGEGDHDTLNEQAGLLLADTWRFANLCTFYRIDWYDWLSCGNNARESWWTVDATTGNLMTLDDMVLPEMRDSLSTLMMPRLINGKGEYLVRLYDFYTLDDKDVLPLANGCALIPEGLIIYFYPYNLGCGADGEFEAVIPYNKLDGILKGPLSASLVPSPEDEDIDIRQYVRKDRKPNIDLFGIEMVGTPKRILRELAKNPYLDVDLGPEGFVHYNDGQFSCRVLLDGIPFGMTVTYGKDGEEGIVKDLKFVTGETDHRLLDTIVKNLKSYYGEPEIIDMPEEYYKWFPRGHFMQARPLHHDDGGWTFYIMDN